MRPIRLAVLVASTLVVVLVQAPSSWAGTSLSRSTGPMPALAAPAQATVSFTAPNNYAAGDGSVSVAIGDFNGGGDPDLAVANELTNFSGDVSVLVGGGGGTFGAAA
jgi:hypothetical protein